MGPQPIAFQESHPGDRPIRDLGLRSEGTDLEPVIAELERAGIHQVRLRFYLSSEWGCPSAQSPSPSPSICRTPS